MTRDRLIVTAIVGVIFSFTTIRVAWNSSMQLQQWQHGLFMIALGGAAIGFVIGKWNHSK